MAAGRNRVQMVHLRRSNTEPIMRIYAESNSPDKADALAKQIIAEMQELEVRIG